ncbi:MAG: hypothetical protein U0441_28295 [Polyangiaceae bacterium]
MKRFALTLLPALLVACSATGSGQNTGGSTAGSGGSTGGSIIGGSGGGIQTGGSGGGTNADCDAASTYVYVLSDENDMYSFQPADKIFTKIGHLGCNTTLQPNSMAIDRNATAWVNYVDNNGFSDSAGVVYRVSTKDASCEAQPAANLPQDWFRLGMGFSTDGAAGSTAETLYLTGTGSGASPGLGKLDTANGQLTPLGAFTGALSGQNAELTGTGDGRLYGFFTTTPVQVVELNKTNGATITPVSLPQVETPAAWAFSFWGGDFYLYTAPDPLVDPTRTTNVTRYRPSDGSVDPSYMVNIGFRIVGAGVSTCAPLEPPK